MNIRKALPRDHESILAINASAAQTLRAIYGRNGKPQTLDTDTSELIVLEFKGKLVGRCQYKFTDNALYFFALGILKKYRGLGLFRQLFQFLEMTARQHGCGQLTCETIEETGNQKIFESVGMKVLKRLPSQKYQAPGGGKVHELFLFKNLI